MLLGLFWKRGLLLKGFKDGACTAMPHHKREQYFLPKAYIISNFVPTKKISFPYYSPPPHSTWQFLKSTAASFYKVYSISNNSTIFKVEGHHFHWGWFVGSCHYYCDAVQFRPYTCIVGGDHASKNTLVRWEIMLINEMFKWKLNDELRCKTLTRLCLWFPKILSQDYVLDFSNIGESSPFCPIAQVPTCTIILVRARSDLEVTSISWKHALIMFVWMQCEDRKKKRRFLIYMLIFVISYYTLMILSSARQLIGWRGAWWWCLFLFSFRAGAVDLTWRGHHGLLETWQ